MQRLFSKILPFHVSIAVAMIAAVAVVAAGVVKPKGFDPDAACVGNQRMVASALSQYIQDYDEVLPNMQTISAFDGELGVYVQGNPSNALNCPATGKAYTPNASLSYQHYYSIQDLSKAEVITDTSPHADGVDNVAYLDEHISQNGVVQGDPKALTRQYANQLALGLDQYAQDWNEQYPNMQNEAAFQDAIYPYVMDSAYFTSPDTGGLFTPNSNVSYVDITSLDAYTTQALSDDAGTTAFVDTHVEQDGWALDQSQQSVSYLKQIGLATDQYVWNNDAYYPLMNSYQEFVDELSPYTDHNTSLFTQPGTNLPYVLNTSLSGENLAYVYYPTQTVFVSDAVLEPNGDFSTGYADGHVDTVFYFVPFSLTIGPTGQPGVVWRDAQPPYAESTTPTGSIWDLNPNGDVIKKLNCGSGGWNGVLTQVSTLHGDQRMILWDGGSGIVTVQSTGSNGLISQSVTGPFDGWQPVGIASRQPNTRVLLKRYDGEVALWTVSSTGSYERSVILNAPTDETPVAVQVGAGGITYILFNEPDGSADIWTVSGKGVLQTQQHYATANASQSIVGFTLGDDGLIRLLLNDQNGVAEVHTVDSAGNTTASLTVQQASDSIPSQVVMNSAGDAFLLWKYPMTGQGVLLSKVEPIGKVDYSKTFLPYM